MGKLRALSQQSCEMSQRYFERVWVQFILSVLLISLTCEGENIITAKCNEDAELTCTATERSNKYRFVMWKRSKTSERNGDDLPKAEIIKRKLNIITFYNNSSPASLGANETLVLRNVKPTDSGKYECYLAAELGGTNQMSYATLRVSECEAATTYPTCTSSPTDTSPEKHVVISTLMTIMSFVIVGLAKVVLSILTVWVFSKIMKKRGSWGPVKNRR